MDMYDVDVSKALTRERFYIPVAVFTLSVFLKKEKTFFKKHENGKLKKPFPCFVVIVFELLLQCNRILLYYFYRCYYSCFVFKVNERKDDR